MHIHRPDGLDVLPPGYGELFDRAAQRFAANDVEWPAELADAVVGYLEREGFGVD